MMKCPKLELRTQRAAVRIGVEPEDEDDEMFYPEGAVLFVKHRKLERNPKLVKRLKSKRLGEKGDLTCEVCGFSFQEQYGELGAGFIEAHHTVPVGGFKGPRVTRLEEMALVCSNCHRMLHRGNPLLSITTLRKIRNNKALKTAAQ
jgi:predicted HNH restriction endonuclease